MRGKSGLGFGFAESERVVSDFTRGEVGEMRKKIAGGDF